MYLRKKGKFILITLNHESSLKRWLAHHIDRWKFLISVTKAFLNEDSFLRIPTWRSKFLECFDHFFAAFVHHATKYYVCAVQPKIKQKNVLI